MTAPDTTKAPEGVAVTPDSRRARILGVALHGPITLSEIERKVGPSGARKDRSIHRLKTTSAIRALKRDGLLARGPSGWIVTASGVEAMRGRS